MRLYHLIEDIQKIHKIATLLQRVILGVNIAIPIIIRLIHMTGQFT